MIIWNRILQAMVRNAGEIKIGVVSMKKMKSQKSHGKLLGKTQVKKIIEQGLAKAPVDGKRVLVLTPDCTRSGPMPLVFKSSRGRAFAARVQPRFPDRARAPTSPCRARPRIRFME